MKRTQHHLVTASRSAMPAALLAAVISATALRTHAAQPRADGARSGNPACNILSPEELRTITGYPGYRQPSPGDDAGQGAGGGASCQYMGGLAVDAKGKPVNEKGPLLSLVVIDGKNYTKTKPMARGCKNEAVSGVGDAAFFELCPSSGRVRQTPPLYLKSGNKDLILQLDIEESETLATAQSKLIAVAKAAAAKVR
jgi:hypothetical protein